MKLSAIFSAAAQGNQDAIEALLCHLQIKVERACQRRVEGRVAARTDWQDATQLCLLRVYQSLQAGKWADKQLSQLESWTILQAREICCKLIRDAQAQKRDVRAEESRDAVAGAPIDIASSDLSPEEHACNCELIESLLALVKRADDKQILAGIMEGLSLQAIADAVGCTLEQVYYRTKYLRKLAKRVAV